MCKIRHLVTRKHEVLIFLQINFQVLAVKGTYARSLKNLEQISESIHAARLVCSLLAHRNTGLIVVFNVGDNSNFSIKCILCSCILFRLASQAKKFFHFRKFKMRLPQPTREPGVGAELKSLPSYDLDDLASLR